MRITYLTSFFTKNFKIAISVALLIISTLLLFFVLFSQQPIQIVLETGQEVTSQSANYFSIIEAMILIIASFLLGATSVYLYYNSEIAESEKTIVEVKKESIAQSYPAEKYSLIMPFLRDEEKKVFVEIKNKGEILQNELVLSTGFSKVKITRILANLERKNLVVRERYGLTNKVKLK